MRALGHHGEWWRRCAWWREAHVDGEENGWSILLHRCGRCGVEEGLMADACSTIADDRAKWKRAHPEDENARICGICTYCGEVIRGKIRVLLREFDDLTYCRGVWWIRAHGGVYYQRCYWWDVESLQLDTKNIRTKQCLRCVEEEKVLDGVHGHMCLAHTE